METMMNIECRAKALGTNKWVYGYYVKQKHTTYCFKDDADKLPNPEKHFIAFDRMIDWGLPNSHELMEIDPETLGLSLGRKDMKGNDIYTGDILRIHYNGLKDIVVAYVPHELRFNAAAYNLSECEVIGNIFEPRK